METAQDITLPRELANGTLTLEEIGAIFVLMNFREYSERWKENEVFKLNIEALMKEGIISLTENNEVHIDLTWI